jgi:hypothetical protein
VRGQISIATSAYTDHAEVASYIVRARQSEGEEKEPNNLVIDPSIKTSPQSVVLIFKRNDTGKMVKAVFNKSKLAEPETLEKMASLKKKIERGNAGEEEKAQFAGNVQKLVEKVITATPEGLIHIVECTDYHF